LQLTEEFTSIAVVEGVMRIVLPLRAPGEDLFSVLLYELRVSHFTLHFCANSGGPEQKKI